MRIAGVDLKNLRKESLMASLGEGEISLTVTAFPYGFTEELMQELPMPEPPWQFIRGKGGKIERGEAGEPIKYKDTQNPSYKLDLQKVSALHLAAQFYEALREESKVSFEAQPENFKDKNEFYSRIHKEILESGITGGVVLDVIKLANKLSGIDLEKVDVAKEDFTAAGQD